MISVGRPGRFFALLLLLYLTADFMDPFTPGVFFFEKDSFFVDGVIEFKSTAPAPPKPVLPMIPDRAPAIVNDQHAAMKVCAAAQLLTPQQPRSSTDQKHDRSSLASTSPPDPEPVLS